VSHTLVIDDEAAVRAMLCAVLAMAGHEVFEAGDGAEALRLLEGQSVDLVFCDLFMPGMGGLEAIPRIRRLRPEARVIAMSGGGGSNPAAVLNVALRLGAVVALDKPFDVDRMLSAAAEALAKE
jgi:CheY-like chemotaxis protein